MCARAGLSGQFIFPRGNAGGSEPHTAAALPLAQLALALPGAPILPMIRERIHGLITILLIVNYN